MKKLILALSLSSLCQLALAETCPSINDIKHLALSEWRAYDSEDGTPLSQSRLQQLRESINAFALAEWSNENNEGGAIHCYYRDNNGSDLDAYFSKEHFKPTNAKNLWYEVSGYLHCAAGMDQCTFENKAVQTNQLAQNK